MAVIGASPVTFISEDATTNHGKQYQIPLSQLSFNTAGEIDVSGWSEYTGLASPDKTLVTNLLKTLVNQGQLTKPPA
jgi:hypothetical protein